MMSKSLPRYKRQTSLFAYCQTTLPLGDRLHGLHLELRSHRDATARELRPQSLLQFWLLLVFFFIYLPNTLLYIFSYLHVWYIKCYIMNLIKWFNEMLGKVIKAKIQAEAKIIVAIADAILVQLRASVNAPSQLPCRLLSDSHYECSNSLLVCF